MRPLGLNFDPDAHRYYWNGIRVPSVTQVLFDWSPFARLDRGQLEAARALGRDVHRAAELDDRGELDESSIDSTVAGYLLAWRRFSADWEPEWTAIEEPAYCARYGYAGTPDRIGTLRRGGSFRVAADVKSGGADATHGIQLAGYSGMISRPGTARRVAIYLSPDGHYRLAWFPNHAEDWRVFLSCLTTFRHFKGGELVD